MCKENPKREIEQNVTLQLGKLGLRPIQPIAEMVSESDYNLTGTVESLSGEKRFIKMMLVPGKQNPQSGDIFPKRDLRREILFYKFFNSVPVPDRKVVCPRFIAGDAGEYPWLLIDIFVPSMKMTFQDQFLRREFSTEQVDQLIDGVKYFQSLSYMYPDLLKLLPAFKVTEKELFDEYFQRNSEWISGLVGTVKSKRLKENISGILPIWSKNNSYLVHGDFSLQNFGFEKGTLAVIDWEHVHVNNQTFDLAKAYTQLWLYPELREHLMLGISKKYNEKDFTPLFRCGVVVWCLSELRNLEHSILDENFGYSKRVKGKLSREEQILLFEQGIQDHKKTISLMLELASQ